MKKALVAVALYAGAGVAAELAFVSVLNRRFPRLSDFTVTRALLWPVLVANVVTGRTALSQPSGVEPAKPGAFGAIPRNAVNPAQLAAAGGVRAGVRASPDAVDGLSVKPGVLG